MTKWLAIIKRRHNSSLYRCIVPSIQKCTIHDAKVQKISDICKYFLKKKVIFDNFWQFLTKSGFNVRSQCKVYFCLSLLMACVAGRLLGETFH